MAASHGWFSKKDGAIDKEKEAKKKIKDKIESKIQAINATLKENQIKKEDQTQIDIEISVLLSRAEITSAYCTLNLSMKLKDKKAEYKIEYKLGEEITVKKLTTISAVIDNLREYIDSITMQYRINAFTGPKSGVEIENNYVDSDKSAVDVENDDSEEDAPPPIARGEEIELMDDINKILQNIYDNKDKSILDPIDQKIRYFVKKQEKLVEFSISKTRTLNNGNQRREIELTDESIDRKKLVSFLETLKVDITNYQKKLTEIERQAKSLLDADKEQHPDKYRESELESDYEVRTGMVVKIPSLHDFWLTLLVADSIETCEVNAKQAEVKVQGAAASSEETGSTLRRQIVVRRREHRRTPSIAVSSIQREQQAVVAAAASDALIENDERPPLPGVSDVFDLDGELPPPPNLNKASASPPPLPGGVSDDFDLDGQLPPPPNLNNASASLPPPINRKAKPSLFNF